MQLQITGQLIGSIGKEALQAMKESITIALFDFMNKFSDLKR